METAAYFLEKAAQCRRLADFITRPNHPAKAALSALAEEFEGRLSGRAGSPRQNSCRPTGSKKGRAVCCSGLEALGVSPLVERTNVRRGQHRLITIVPRFISSAKVRKR